MQFTLSTASVTGQANNASYPHQVQVDSAEALQQAVAYDHVCGTFEKQQRSINNFRAADCLIMDCDNDHSENPDSWMKPSDLANYFEDVAYAVTFSRNHMKEKHGKAARPKFHVYFPIQPITDAKVYADLKHEIQDYFPYFDDNALDAARFVFGVAQTQVKWHDGTMTVDQLMMSQRFFAQSGNQEIPEGKRNATLSHFAGRVIMRLGATTKAYQAFLDEADKCDPPLPNKELNAIWQSALKFGQRMTRQPSYIPPEEYGNPDQLKYLPTEFTDDNEADIFAKSTDDHLRFTKATGYLSYDGKTWIESQEMALLIGGKFASKQLQEARAAKAAIWQKLDQAGVLPVIQNNSAKKALSLLGGEPLKLFKQYQAMQTYVAFALKRLEYRPLTNMVKLAKARLMTDIAAFDHNPYLLNTPAGTYDLRKGTLAKQPHQAKDRLTKITQTAPGNQGTEEWQQAVNTFFCGDQDLINYVQEIVGLVAIGQVFMEAMIIAYGDGRNGKSTFWNTIANVLGNYTGHLSADALTTGVRRNIKPEMAELRGKRLVISAELEEGRRLNSSTVKQLCSTDEIYAEKKYMEPFSFVPSHTLVLYTNYLPHVGGNDDGIWRRLIVIPFKAKITGHSDIKNYTQYLTNHCGPAVLQWIIEGAQRIIKQNFQPKVPDVVKQAMSNYHEDNDWLDQFLTAKCDVGDSYVQKSGQLYKTYREYCLSLGEYIRSTSDFYTALKNAGFVRRRRSSGSFIYGLQLKADDLDILD